MYLLQSHWNIGGFCPMGSASGHARASASRTANSGWQSSALFASASSTVHGVAFSFCSNEMAATWMIIIESSQRPQGSIRIFLIVKHRSGSDGVLHGSQALHDPHGARRQHALAGTPVEVPTGN